MRFLFVDRIDHYSDTSISGVRFFRMDEPLQYPIRGGLGSAQENQIAPGVVSEAIGQLASWLAIKKNGFTGRPVFLFADHIKVDHPVTPGSNVELKAEIHQMDTETMVFSGSALVEGRMVQAVTNCSGYFMPLDQLEDPAVTRERWGSLVAGGLLLDHRSGARYPFASFSDEVLGQDGSASIVIRRTMRADEPFYADHFPRFPVTPIVMLNELIGSAAGRLAKSLGATNLMVRSVSGVKIKNFVKPGETVIVRIRNTRPELSSSSPVAVMTGNNSETRIFETIAEIEKDGKTILRGRYSYEMLQE